MLAALLLGFGIGFFGSMPPIGPGALLQVRRGLQHRVFAGMAVALGGGLTDAAYCLIATFGLGYLMDRYPVLVEVFRWAGVFVLAILGIVFLFRQPKRVSRDEADPHDKHAGVLARELLLGATLTGSNPSVLVTWSTVVGLVAAFDAVRLDDWARVTFPAGVALGNLAWSAILLTLLHRYGDRLSDRILKALVKSAGVFLLGLSVVWGVKVLGSDPGDSKSGGAQVADP